MGSRTRVGHADQADDGEQKQDGADGKRAGDVTEAFGKLAPEIFLVAAAGRSGGDGHEQQAENHGEVADAVDGEAPGFAEGGDDQASEGRAEKAGGVDHGGVEGNGVGEDGAVFDHLDEESLAGGVSKALMTPCRTLSTAMCQMAMRPLKARAARAKDCNMERTWVQTKVR